MYIDFYTKCNISINFLVFIKRPSRANIIADNLSCHLFTTAVCLSRWTIL